MKKTSLEVKSNIMLNLNPGQSVTCVVDSDGVVYLPAFKSPIALPSEDKVPTAKAEAKTPDVVEKPKVSAAKEEALPPKAEPQTKVQAKVYSEDELKEMSAKDIRTILEDDLGIDVEAAMAEANQTKATNKFVRELLLEVQSGASEEVAEEEVEEAPETSEEEEAEITEEEVAKSALGTLNALNDGEIERVPAEQELFDFISKNFDIPKSDVKAYKLDIRDFIENFLEDVETPIEDYAQKFVALVFGEEVEEEGAEVEEEGAESAETQSYEDLEEVSASDLKVGDKVAVYWTTEENWFEGEVTKKLRGNNVMIRYSDGEEDKLNPEVTTKIVLI